MNRIDGFRTTGLFLASLLKKQKIKPDCSAFCEAIVFHVTVIMTHKANLKETQNASTDYFQTPLAKSFRTIKFNNRNSAIVWVTIAEQNKILSRYLAWVAAKKQETVIRATTAWVTYFY